MKKFVSMVSGCKWERSKNGGWIFPEPIHHLSEGRSWLNEINPVVNRVGLVAVVIGIVAAISQVITNCVCENIIIPVKVIIIEIGIIRNTRINLCCETLCCVEVFISIVFIRASQLIIGPRKLIPSDQGVFFIELSTIKAQLNAFIHCDWIWFAVSHICIWCNMSAKSLCPVSETFSSLSSFNHSCNEACDHQNGTVS